MSKLPDMLSSAFSIRLYSSLPSYLRFSFLFFASILLSGLTTNSWGQIIIPLSQINPDITKEYLLDVSSIEGIDGQLYISSNAKLWILSQDGRRLRTEIDVTDYVPVIQALGDQLLVAMGQDLVFFSKDGKKLREIKGIKEPIASVHIIESRIFVTTRSGLYVVSGDGEQIKVVRNFIQTLQSIRAIDDYIFFNTEEESFVADKDGTLIDKNDTVFKNIDGNVTNIIFTGDQFYAGTDDGLWIVPKDGSPPRKANNVNGFVTIIKAFGEYIIVQSNTGLWLVNQNGEAYTVENVALNVHTIEAGGSSLFIATFQGLWMIQQGEKQAEKVETIRGMVQSLDLIDEQLFVATDAGLWIINLNESPLGKFKNIARLIKGGVKKVIRVGEYRYILVPENIYRADLKNSIETKLTSSSSWAAVISSFLSSKWLPSGNVSAAARYSDESGKDPYEESVLREFSFAKAEGDSVPDEQKFAPQDQFTYEIGLGRNEVHYWVKDGWGNTFEKSEVYYGFPNQNFIVVVPLFLSAGFILVCFVLAPNVGFCHAMIMNPWLRNYFSLGSIPLLISLFPSLRRHILRRYLSSIGKDKEFTDWKTRYILPDEEFLPEHFGKRIFSERRLLLTGQSGIGKTSFFKYLTTCYASKNKPPLPAKVFPVYISLTNYGGNSLEDLIYGQLYAHGSITDKELAPMFLEQGGLLIFFDGINEVQAVDDRRKLRQFIEKYWTSNYICLSSQQSYPETENIPKVELIAFGKEKIGEFIRQRAVDNKKAETVISEMTEEQYKIYSVPRDLEFAVEILNGGVDFLPTSRTELYKTIFSFIFEQWRQNGQTEAEYVLCKRAYDMIAAGTLAFDLVENPEYNDITADLLEQKLLSKRGKNYYFRHDMIRAFLASEYFYPGWKNLLGTLDGKFEIDSNWLEMLKFSCENIKEASEVKNLVYTIMDKSNRKNVVKDLMIWLKANHLDKFEDWERNFYAKYGEIDFN